MLIYFNKTLLFHSFLVVLPAFNWPIAESRIDLAGRTKIGIANGSKRRNYPFRCTTTFLAGNGIIPFLYLTEFLRNSTADITFVFIQRNFNPLSSNYSHLSITYHTIFEYSFTTNIFGKNKSTFSLFIQDFIKTSNNKTKPE